MRDVLALLLLAAERVAQRVRQDLEGLLRGCQAEVGGLTHSRGQVAPGRTLRTGVDVSYLREVCRVEVSVLLQLAFYLDQPGVKGRALAIVQSVRVG